MNMLPILHTELEAIHPQIYLTERGRIRIRPRLPKLKFMQLARAAERAVELVHCRTGKGPAPGSSSMCPVSKRDRLYAPMRSGGVPVATNVAKAAPEAGMALKPP